MTMPERRDVQGQLDDLSVRLAATEAQLAGLEEADRTAGSRADASDRRVADLESRVNLNQELIHVLQTEGLLSTEHARNLEAALETARRIGAAVGVVMAFQRVTEPQAFELLRRASMDRNTKLRLLADEVVRTGSLDGPPVP